MPAGTLVRIAAFFLVLLAARDASAWSGSLHRSIVEGAWRVSPAAAARVPEVHRDAVLNSCAGTDSSERLADPGAEAEQILRAILARPAGRFSYNDALAVGRYLHDVAHAAVPHDSRPSGPRAEEIFSSREVAVFRDPSPRAASLREALDVSRQDGSFSENRDEGLGARYRLAVQATVDALLRLPRVGEPAVDSGFDVYIVADLVDNGKTGPREVGKSQERWQEIDSWGDVWNVTKTTTLYDMSHAGKGHFLRKSYETTGVKTLEWTTRREGATARHRLLVLNNTHECFGSLRVREKGMVREVPAPLPARAIARVEFETADSTPRAEIRLAPVPSRCADVSPASGTLSANRLLGVPAIVTVGPRWGEAFVAPLPEPRATRPPGPK
jgi:hypothetical protein